MWKTTEASSGRLVQLCVFYFLAYVATGVTVKYFLGSAEQGFPGMKGMEFLPYSTLGGVTVATGVALALRWFRLPSNRWVGVGRLRMPVEMLYIFPSGVCTAVVVPTTTLMYTLPISVMVAMVIMRGSVIIISRVVDAVQVRQGLLKKKVYWTENTAVLFAILAVAMKTVFVSEDSGAFDFVNSRAAMTILGSYVLAYAVRIYIMNFYKNTRGKGVKQDNKSFYFYEQMSMLVVLIVVTIIVFNSPQWFGWTAEQVQLFNGAIDDPLPQWRWAVLAGGAFGVASFFSVFLFMFKGRTATFAGLVNRLTSLIAGTAATLIFHYAFGGRFPSREDWLSLVCILVAIGFLTVAERKRVTELRASA